MTTILLIIAAVILLLAGGVYLTIALVARSMGEGLYRTIRALGAGAPRDPGQKKQPHLVACQIPLKEALGTLAPVKLIPSSDLASLERFPRYQDYTTGLTLAAYIERQKRAADGYKRSEPIETYFDLTRRLREIDHGDPVTYEHREIIIPGSIFRSHLTLDIGAIPQKQSSISASEGSLVGNKLQVQAAFTRRSANLTFSCPSHILHAAAIQRLQQELAQTPEPVREEAERLRAAFAPVLFISHRWQTVHDPDPHGHQLQRLRALHGCYLIYDYTSFPQTPYAPGELETLTAILERLPLLMKKVITLKSDDHLTRGWLNFEYLVAAMQRSIVCDEVSDPAFQQLHGWFHTKAPIPLNLFHDSIESMQLNSINEQRLHFIRQIAPKFAKAIFSLDIDRKNVTERLITYLLGALPSRKLHQPHMGEWRTVRWQRHEIEALFTGYPAEERQDQTLTISMHDPAVPTTLAEASRRGFEINTMGFDDLLDDFVNKRTRP